MILARIVGNRRHGRRRTKGYEGARIMAGNSHVSDLRGQETGATRWRSIQLMRGSWLLPILCRKLMGRTTAA